MHFPRFSDLEIDYLQLQFSIKRFAELGIKELKANIVNLACNPLNKESLKITLTVPLIIP